MKFTSAILIAATCVVLGDAKAQPLDRNNVCAVLAVAHGTLLSDNLPPDQRADDVRYVYNFEAETYDCDGQSYPTQMGTILPAYFGIGFSDDNNRAFIGIETMPANDSGIGRGYTCIFQRTAEERWEAMGCRAVDVWHHQNPPDPIPLP